MPRPVRVNNTKGHNPGGRRSKIGRPSQQQQERLCAEE